MLPHRVRVDVHVRPYQPAARTVQQVNQIAVVDVLSHDAVRLGRAIGTAAHADRFGAPKAVTLGIVDPASGLVETEVVLQNCGDVSGIGRHAEITRVADRLTRRHPPVY